MTVTLPLSWEAAGIECVGWAAVGCLRGVVNSILTDSQCELIGGGRADCENMPPILTDVRICRLYPQFADGSNHTVVEISLNVEISHYQRFDFLSVCLLFQLASQ